MIVKLNMLINQSYSPNRHEMLFLKSTTQYNFINLFETKVLDTFHKVILFDPDAFKFQLHEKLNLRKENIIPLCPILSLLSTEDRVSIMDRFIRGKIWEAIRDGFEKVSFIFNYFTLNEKFKAQILECENVLKTICQRFYGFPISCICLHNQMLNVFDLVNLLRLHTDFKVENKRINVNMITESFIENLPLTQTSSESINQLQTIKRLSFSSNNDPFYIKDLHGKILDVVTNLPDLLQKLETLPLNEFCVHCYRKTNYDLQGKDMISTPRSDIALWIEYTIGDTILAERIFKLVNENLGYYESYESASTYAKSKTRTLLLNALQERIDFLLDL